MRLNAKEMPQGISLFRYSIRDYNGNKIPLCSTIDTDEGYAECIMCNIDADGNKILVYGDDVIGYTLYTFEVWDNDTDVLVARV